MEMQERIAARRAELERQRREEEAAAKAIRNADEVERRIQREAELDQALSANLDQGVSEPDRLLAGEVSKRWTPEEKTWAYGPMALGAVLLFVMPPLGACVFLFGAWRYGVTNERYRRILRERHPEAFGHVDHSKPTRWQRLWWNPNAVTKTSKKEHPDI